MSRPGRLPLVPLRDEASRRHIRDQLEVLTALIDGPSFDPLFRTGDEIVIPADHPVYRWRCLVADCARVRSTSGELCSVHHQAWMAAKRAGEYASLKWPHLGL